MLKLLLISSLLAVVYFNLGYGYPSNPLPCVANPNKTCSKEYMPVCACRSVGNSLCCQTYANKCYACLASDDPIEVFSQGICPNAGKDSCSVGGCPTSEPEVCPQHYEPVCGCTNSGKCADYSNNCYACTNAAIMTYTAGMCK